VTIASGGVLPKICPEILQRKCAGKFVTAPPSAKLKPSRSPPATGPKKAAATKKLTAKGKPAGRGSSTVIML